MIRVYFDACAVLRLLDDQSQERVRAEAAAMEQVFQGIAAQQVLWVASTPLKNEFNRNENAEQRFLAIGLLRFAGEVFDPKSATYARSEAYQAHGLGTFDALHLACAEDSLCSALLTTDDRLMRRAARLPTRSTRIDVINPVDWVQRSGLWRL